MKEPLVLYINLLRSERRRGAMEARLRDAGFKTWQRIEACDGQKLDLASFDAYSDKDTAATIGRSLLKSEVACYQSHLASLDAFLSSDADHAIIFEDDALVPGNLAQLVEGIVQTLDGIDLEWDVVHLGALNINQMSSRVAAFAGHEICVAHFFPIRMHAILWTRPAAERFVQRYRKILMPVDKQLSEDMIRSGTGLVVWPSPVMQEGLESDIEASGGRRKTFKKRWNEPLLRWRRKKRNKEIAAEQMLQFEKARRDGA